jgi:hypothetical protein
MTHKTLPVAFIICAVSSTRAAAQSPSPTPTEPQPERCQPDRASFAVNFGQLQPWVTGGANIEGDFRVGHLVVGYSHGWSLDLEGSTITGDMKRQRVTLHIPYTTGLGVGYSHHLDALRSYVDLRFEAKLHRFEASYDSADGKQRSRIADYSTVTIGAGAYWTWLPLAHRADSLHGINISASVRYWPNVASTLKGGAVAYSNASTNQEEMHKTANIGIANTPIVANISIGYIFQ